MEGDYTTRVVENDDGTKTYITWKNSEPLSSYTTNDDGDIIRHSFWDFNKVEIVTLVKIKTSNHPLYKDQKIKTFQETNIDGIVDGETTHITIDAKGVEINRSHAWYENGKHMSSTYYYDDGDSYTDDYY